MGSGLRSFRLLDLILFIIASLASPIASLIIPSAPIGPRADSHRARDFSLPLSPSNVTKPLSGTPDIAFKDAIKTGERYAREHIDSQAVLLYIIADWEPNTERPKYYPRLGMAFRSWPSRTPSTEEFKIDDDIFSPFGTGWIGPSPWPKSEVKALRGLPFFRATDVGMDLDAAWKIGLQNGWVWTLRTLTVIRKHLWGVEDIWYHFYAVQDQYPVMLVGSRSKTVRLLLGPMAGDDDVAAVGWISGVIGSASNRTVS